jgi:transposase
MQITTIGLELAKRWFQVHGVDANGHIVVRKRLWRSAVIPYFRSLEPCLVGMEACATAHHWARELIALGHTVKLMPPAYVKAYVKRNKNDAADAEAICEAVARPSMRFVPVKDTEQQAVLMLHRARSLLVRQRTAGQCLARPPGRIRHHCAAGFAACRIPDKDNRSWTGAAAGARARDPAEDC